MKKATIKYRGQLASLTGVPEEIIEVAGPKNQLADVEDVLKAIRSRHSREAEKEARTMLIALNGESILLLKRFKTKVKDGDTISFFPLCAGG